MIILLEEEISQKTKDAILLKVNQSGYKITEVRTQKGNYLVGIGNRDFDIRLLGSMDGVKDIYRVSDSYKLVSRKWKVNPTVIDLGDTVFVREGEFSIMAGPCSIESQDQIEKVIGHLLENNVKIMRGGVFKPRSSPYAFRGSGMEGLILFHKLCRQNGIKIITEVMQVSQIADMYDYIDIFQVGARNSQNFNLLDELGKVDKPVMIKIGRAHV